MVRKSHRAKWGSQLQISSNANVAAEGPLSFCSSGAVSVPRAQAQKTSLSLLFLIICTLTELEYLLHTEALCANPSAETMQPKPIFFAFCRSFSWIFLSCRCLSFPFPPYIHWLFPCSTEHAQHMQLYVMTPGLGYPAVILKFSCTAVRLLCYCEEVRVHCTRVALGHRCLGDEQCVSSSFPLHKGACRFGWRARSWQALH